MQLLNKSIRSEDQSKKILDKGTGTLGERIITLFWKQGITIVSIFTAVGMAIGF